MNRLVERICEARNFVAGAAWHDGVSEGIQLLERSIAENQIKIILAEAAKVAREQYADSGWSSHYKNAAAGIATAIERLGDSFE